MKKIYSTVSVIFFLFSFAKAQNVSPYQKKVLIEGADTLPYMVLLPENFDANKSYPLILFLHSAGERGNDNEKQLIHGFNLFLEDSIRKNYPAIVVFPQCSESSFWSNIIISVDSATNKRSFGFDPGGEPTTAMKLLLALLPRLNIDYKLDKSRLYVVGLSMGGMGTFELVRRVPNTFASAFPICGGADTSTAKLLKPTAWWIFHGLRDNVVDPQFSKNMAAALKNNVTEGKLTLYPDANHNSWDSAFKEPDLFPWIFSHKK